MLYEEIKKARTLSKKTKMLLHACCAICASHVINILHDEFDISVDIVITEKQIISLEDENERKRT